MSMQDCAARGNVLEVSAAENDIIFWALSTRSTAWHPCTSGRPWPHHAKWCRHFSLPPGRRLMSGKYPLPCQCASDSHRSLFKAVRTLHSPLVEGGPKRMPHQHLFLRPLTKTPPAAPNLTTALQLSMHPASTSPRPQSSPPPALTFFLPTSTRILRPPILKFPNHPRPPPWLPPNLSSCNLQRVSPTGYNRFSQPRLPLLPPRPLTPAVCGIDSSKEYTITVLDIFRITRLYFAWQRSRLGHVIVKAIASSCIMALASLCVCKNAFMS